MDQIIDLITSNIIYLLITIIISIMIIISIIKKLMKLFIISLLILGLYAGYLTYTGQKIPSSKDEIIKHISEQSEKLKKSGKESIDKLLEEKVKKSISGEK